MTIVTDSKCSIDSFKKMTSPLISHQGGKKNYLITSRNLTVSLQKTKAHANDVFNDLADTLAKKGRSCSDVLTVAYHLPCLPITNHIKWDSYIIDKPIWRESTESWLINESAFESVSQKDSRIDWHLTRRCTSHSYRGNQLTSISH